MQPHEFSIMYSHRVFARVIKGIKPMPFGHRVSHRFLSWKKEDIQPRVLQVNGTDDIHSRGIALVTRGIRRWRRLLHQFLRESRRWHTVAAIAYLIKGDQRITNSPEDRVRNQGNRDDGIYPTCPKGSPPSLYQKIIKMKNAGSQARNLIIKHFLNSPPPPPPRA